MRSITDKDSGVQAEVKASSQRAGAEGTSVTEGTSAGDAKDEAAPAGQDTPMTDAKVCKDLFRLSVSSAEHPCFVRMVILSWVSSIWKASHVQLNLDCVVLIYCRSLSSLQMPQPQPLMAQLHLLPLQRRPLEASTACPPAFRRWVLSQIALPRRRLLGSSPKAKLQMQNQYHWILDARWT